MIDHPKNDAGRGQVEARVESHKKATRQFLKLIETVKIEEATRQYAAVNGRQHNPYFKAGFGALQKGMQENYDQFQQIRLSVKNVLGDGDLAAIYSQVVQMPGQAGTAGVHIFRFEGDTIAEFWDVEEPVPAESPNKDSMFQ